MAAKLKVFTWSDGFHAFTVAAPSRPKALAAWGVEQDLFKTGLAHQIESGGDRDAALASPGSVISRSLSVEIGTAKTRTARPANAKAKARLKALEADLDHLNIEQTAQIQDLDDREADLKRRRQMLGEAHEAAREALTLKIRAARKAAG